jgi:hypothetical protein
VGDAQDKNQRRWRKKWRVITSECISYTVKQLISKEKGPCSPFLMVTRILAAEKPIASQA